MAPSAAPTGTNQATAPGAKHTQALTADAQISSVDGRQYWEGINADVDGMLGGFAPISRTDLQGSRAFLAKLGIGTKSGLKTVGAALDGGAGIGRITRGLLLDIAEQVDIVEPIAKFTAALADEKGVRDIYNVGLEEWTPTAEYDLIWNQWCLGHLTDEQLEAFLRRCSSALAPDGVIVVKENLSTSGLDLFDDTDSSVTRIDQKFRTIFAAAGLRIIQTQLQRGFPKELFPVRMYALKPQ